MWRLQTRRRWLRQVLVVLAVRMDAELRALVLALAQTQTQTQMLRAGRDAAGGW